MIPLIHTVLIYLWTVSATIVIGTIAIIVSIFDRTGDRVHRVARIWARSLLWISFVKVRVNGLSHIDSDAPYIYMANQQSNFDFPVLLGSLMVQFRWLAKAELFRIPIFGRSMRGAGYISIDRSNRESAFRSLRQAAATIREGASVLIFPEGTRSEDGGIIPFKKGGFVLAIEAGVPIVPIIIRGTRQIMPKYQLLVRSGPVKLDILKPVQTSGYSMETRNQLVKAVREAMIQAGTGLERGE